MASRSCNNILCPGKFLILTMLVFIFIGGPLYAQEQIDLNALVVETQKMTQEADEMTMVWWLPEEFWVASMAQDPTVGQAEADKFINTLRPYTVVVVVDGKVGNFGSVTYKSEATIRTTTKLIDSSGRSYSPLSESSIDAETRNLLQILKPVLSNMLGQMGQNMHFLLFPTKGGDGQQIADATKDGFFTVVLGGREFKYRLPLGSVLPPRFDPETGERFPGNYNYNPFTGTKLVDQNPQ